MTFVSSSLPGGTTEPNVCLSFERSFDESSTDRRVQFLDDKIRGNPEDLDLNYGPKHYLILNRHLYTPLGHVPFLSSGDSLLYTKHSRDAFKMQLAFHECVGHSSSKTLSETEPGVFDFKRDKPIFNPLTQLRLTTWYRPGQTWRDMFSASYEECRCECVGLYLCLNATSLSEFEYVMKDIDLVEGCDKNRLREYQLKLHSSCLREFSRRDQKWFNRASVLDTKNQGQSPLVPPKLIN